MTLSTMKTNRQVDNTCLYVGFRNLYGHLVHLSSRPFSKGNEVASRKAVNSVNDIIEDIGDVYPSYFREPMSLLKALLRSSDILDFKVISGTIVKSFEQFLLRLHGNVDSGPTYHSTAQLELDGLKRIVVSVGPTIGLGDELIAARALLSQTVKMGIEVIVETCQSDLWQLAGLDEEFIIGEPPYSAHTFITSLGDFEKAETGFLFFDFLQSNPNIRPYNPTDGLLYSANWVMGNSSGCLALRDNEALYHFQPNVFMAVNRHLECDWFVRNVLPTQETVEEETTSWVPRKKPERPRVVLQSLTSKPILLLPQEFYCKVFKRVKLLHKPDFAIDVISGVTDKEHEITDNLAKKLQLTLPNAEVVSLPPLKVGEVIDKIRQGSLLVGPDTFTTHAAGLMAVPQVNLCLDKHRAWRPIATPSMYVSITQCSEDDLVKQVAGRIAFMLKKDSLRNIADIRYEAIGWEDSLEGIINGIKLSFDCAQGYPLKKLKPHVENIHRILGIADDLLPYLFTNVLDDEYVNYRFKHFDDHRNDIDLQTPLIRWVQEVSTTDLSGILFSLAEDMR